MLKSSYVLSMVSYALSLWISLLKSFCCKEVPQQVCVTNVPKWIAQPNPAWANYFLPKGHFKKGDNLRTTSNKIMYKTTDSQHLKLKVGRYVSTSLKLLACTIANTVAIYYKYLSVE